MSVYAIKLWLWLTWLVMMAMFIGRLSAGHEDSLMSLVRFDPFFAKFEQSLIVSQIVGHQTFATCTSPKIHRFCFWSSWYFAHSCGLWNEGVGKEKIIPNNKGVGFQKLHVEKLNSPYPPLYVHYVPSLRSLCLCGGVFLFPCTTNIF